MGTVIARFIDLISAYDGIGLSNDRQRYLDLIAPGEAPRMRDAMSGESGCALVVRGFWRLFGVKDRRLDAPYTTGKAVAWLVAIARERGAWVNADRDKLPGVGDMVLVGGDMQRDGGVEHVYVTLELRGDPVTVYSIDGGQVDAGNQQIIRRKERGWILREKAYWDVVIAGSDPGSATQRGRRVKGWVDLERLVGDDAS
jgi:hypothetical protein